jgi:hypothetical protein
MGPILCGYRLFENQPFFEVPHVETYDDVVAITFENSTLSVHSVRSSERQTVIANSAGVIAAQLPN